MTERRLRIAHVIVHPVLVWDDGEELAPGPGVQPVTVPLSQAHAVLDALPAEVARLAHEAKQDDPPAP